MLLHSVANKQIMLTIGRGQHGSTYGGNPVAARVAIASLQVCPTGCLLFVQSCLLCGGKKPAIRAVLFVVWWQKGCFRAVLFVVWCQKAWSVGWCD